MLSTFHKLSQFSQQCYVVDVVIPNFQLIKNEKEVLRKLSKSVEVTSNYLAGLDSNPNLLHQSPWP